MSSPSTRRKIGRGHELQQRLKDRGYHKRGWSKTSKGDAETAMEMMLSPICRMFRAASGFRGISYLLPFEPYRHRARFVGGPVTYRPIS